MAWLLRFKWRLNYLTIIYQKFNVIEFQMLNFIVNKYLRFRKSSKERKEKGFVGVNKFIYLLLFELSEYINA